MFACEHVNRLEITPNGKINFMHVRKSPQNKKSYLKNVSRKNLGEIGPIHLVVLAILFLYLLWQEYFYARLRIKFQS